MSNSMIYFIELQSQKIMRVDAKVPLPVFTRDKEAVDDFQNGGWDSQTR